MQITVPHPTDETADDLGAFPVLLVAMADARLLFYTFGTLQPGADTSFVEPPAHIPEALAAFAAASPGLPSASRLHGQVRSCKDAGHHLPHQLMVWCAQCVWLSNSVAKRLCSLAACVQLLC